MSSRSNKEIVNEIALYLKAGKEKAGREEDFWKTIRQKRLNCFFLCYCIDSSQEGLLQEQREKMKWNHFIEAKSRKRPSFC